MTNTASKPLFGSQHHDEHDSGEHISRSQTQKPSTLQLLNQANEAIGAAKQRGATAEEISKALGHTALTPAQKAALRYKTIQMTTSLIAAAGTAFSTGLATSGVAQGFMALATVGFMGMAVHIHRTFQSILTSSQEQSTENKQMSKDTPDDPYHQYLAELKKQTGFKPDAECIHFGTCLFLREKGSGQYMILVHGTAGKDTAIQNSLYKKDGTLIETSENIRSTDGVFKGRSTSQYKNLSPVTANLLCKIFDEHSDRTTTSNEDLRHIVASFFNLGQKNTEIKCEKNIWIMTDKKTGRQVTFQRHISSTANNIHIHDILPNGEVKKRGHEFGGSHEAVAGEKISHPTAVLLHEIFSHWQSKYERVPSSTAPSPSPKP